MIAKEQILLLTWLIIMLMRNNLYAEKNVWEPQFYREHSSMQHRWANLLLNKSQLPQVGKVLDVGCGDGHISAMLAKKIPKSQVIGLDLSPSMVEYATTAFAKDQYPNLSFVEGDAEELAAQANLAAIVSFSTYHRINNHYKAFESAFRALLPGGQFLAVFPAKMSTLLTECIAEVDSDEKWKQYIHNQDRKSYALSHDHMKELLIDVGFAHVRTASIDDVEVFAHQESLRDHLRAVSSYKDVLPSDKELEFFDEIITCYMRKNPANQDGSITLAASRIEFEAIKPLIPSRER